ncbi:HD domain-containing protein, partial [Streptomyces sp. tea 10]|nr:HD domain-containing protein [Streptomyces sp. tea 10]
MERWGSAAPQLQRPLPAHARPAQNRSQLMTDTISGISVPDSKLAREITEYIRDNEDDLLYHHSRRVFFFGALVGQAQDLSVDHELLYAAAMFHDRGLTDTYSDSMLRFEVDGANEVRDFLLERGASQE